MYLSEIGYNWFHFYSMCHFNTDYFITVIEIIILDFEKVKSGLFIWGIPFFLPLVFSGLIFEGVSRFYTKFDEE